MNIRDHKALVALCTACLIARPMLAAEPQSPWEGSPVGECFANYEIPRPSQDYPVTVQIVKNTDARKNTYVWLWDPTPGTNPTRQLFRITPEKMGCTVLFLPFSEFNDFKLAPNGNLPEKVKSTMATVNDAHGGYFFEHEYRLDKRTGYYEKVPTCYRVKVANSQREKVDCKTSVE